MKKIILIVCTLVFLISLTACGTKFDGSRTGNDSEFIMEYSVLNTTDAQDLTIESGDTISVCRWEANRRVWENRRQPQSDCPLSERVRRTL